VRLETLKLMLDTLGEPCKDAAINTEARMLQDPFVDREDDLAAASGILVALGWSAVILLGLIAIVAGVLWLVL
jgi:hypothetical protein